MTRFLAGEVVSNNHIFLEAKTIDSGTMLSNGGNVTSGASGTTGSWIPNNNALDEAREMCVYGSSLALGYVRVGCADRFINIKLKDEGNNFNMLILY